MKKRYYILTWILLIISNKVKSIELPNSFDLTIKETFGCISSVRTYINFHFENNIFRIIRASDDSQLQIEQFTVKKFESFYNKLLSFNIKKLNSKYHCDKWGTATGFGLLEITNDNEMQKIKYTTQPCDGTDFEKLHKWLSKESLEISNVISFKELINSKFYLIDYISDRAVQKLVEANLKQLGINDFIKTIDSTRIHALKRPMIKCLQYFQDEKVLDLLGPLLIESIDYKEDKNTYWWMTDNSIMLKSILSQKKCVKKSMYLTKLLESKNQKLRLNSAIGLAIDGDSIGVDIIFESINYCLKSSEYCSKWDEFSSLANLSKSIILPKLIANYKLINRKDTELLENSPWIIKGYIALINNFFGNSKYLSPEELRLICVDMNLKTEINKLNKKLNIEE